MSSSSADEHDGHERGRPPVAAALASSPSLRDLGTVVRSGKLSEKYELTHTLLGSGSTGEVFLCLDCTSKEEFACKVVKTAVLLSHPEELKRFEDEINIMARMKHPNIIRLQDVFVDDTTVYIVMELCTGGELFDKILEQKVFSERDARTIMKRLFRAVAYLHQHGVVHRDLKPENILFKSNDPDSDIKIVDFGFATKLLSPKNKHMRSHTPKGTVGYAAPEVFLGTSLENHDLKSEGYSETCDVWSLGIIAYIMLCGVPPFVDPEDLGNAQNTPFWIYVNKMKGYQNGKDLKVDYPPALWKHVTHEAMNFVSCVLEPNPKKRPSARQALLHPWLRSKSTTPSYRNHMQTAVAALHRYTSTLRKDDFERAQKQLSNGRQRTWSSGADGVDDVDEREDISIASSTSQSDLSSSDIVSPVGKPKSHPKGIFMRRPYHSHDAGRKKAALLEANRALVIASPQRSLSPSKPDTNT